MFMLAGANLGDAWGADTSPHGYDLVYAQSADAIAPGIVATAQQIATAGESIVSAIARATNVVNMNDAQRQLLNLQIQRAQSGQAPLYGAQYGISLPGQAAGGFLNNQTVMLAMLGFAALLLLRRS